MIGLSSVRLPSHRNLMETLTLISPHFGIISSLSHRSPPLRRILFKSQISTSLAEVARSTAIGCASSSMASADKFFPISGVEEALMGFITGKRKVTEVAHSVWKNIIRDGDTVVDATCGNGHDTLALLKMVADQSGRGCVYGMDIQTSALENTLSLLEKSVDSNERKLVKLFSLCHSRMEDVIPKDTSVRLVAFNLGYLPGGDKTIITMPGTTLMALHAASRLLMSGGVISIMVYVGHPGGRDELETVRSFTSSLPVESWVSCKFEMLNRPSGPVLVLVSKK
ncbi:tRNA (mnm(5)s(2)U34)-methyltransferase, chloroplastic [Elaeis guineensis]|uniref:Uncharacterized protein LOC105046711 n=1 Tax=Elaeis guineensis var. tenera TaxID=51953 RepID=A0A6I9RB48_ELAGV|nr:uncharacterized protein LOC105046711 [Elaeis guineensis]